LLDLEDFTKRIQNLTLPDGEGQAGPGPEEPPEEPKFVPFRGTGQRLDGKPAASPAIPLPVPARPGRASSCRYGVWGKTKTLMTLKTCGVHVILHIQDLMILVGSLGKEQDGKDPEDLKDPWGARDLALPGRASWCKLGVQGKIKVLRTYRVHKIWPSIDCVEPGTGITQVRHWGGGAGASTSGGGGTPGGTPTANGATVPRQKSGKVVFNGGKGNRLLAKQAQGDAAPTKPPPAPPKPEESKEGPKFAAFSGTGRKLKDDR
jgi:hypothetical protein